MVKEDETQKILDAYVTATHLGANVYHVFLKPLRFQWIQLYGNVLKSSETGKAPILNLK